MLAPPERKFGTHDVLKLTSQLTLPNPDVDSYVSLNPATRLRGQLGLHTHLPTVQCPPPTERWAGRRHSYLIMKD